MLETLAQNLATVLENARLYEDARKLADRDPLTGFFNHRYLHERLSEEVLRAVRTRRPLSVVMLDLDDFKLVNDTYGHMVGDEVLREVARRLLSSVRSYDFVGRYGGEEFVLLLPGTSSDEAMIIAERGFQANARTITSADHAFAARTSSSAGRPELSISCRSNGTCVRATITAAWSSTSTALARSVAAGEISQVISSGDAL